MKVFTKMLIIFAIVTIAVAQVPRTLSFQGKVVEGGTPVTGTRNLTFRMYNVETGGTAFWEETHAGVDVTGGLFNVILGEITTFESIGVEFLDQYWVGVSVGGGAEMTPRYKLTASPYAMADGHWYQDGTNLYCVPTGNVGIGTTTPSYPLHVEESVSGLASEGDAVGSFVNTGGSADVAAVYGECATIADWGYGGYFKGGYRGVYGISDIPGTGLRYGVYGMASDGVTNYGVFGNASGGTTSIGIFGYASGATTNWAGYFDGDVNITGDLTVSGTYPGGGGGGLWTDVTNYIRPNDNTNIWVRDASQTRDIQVNITSGTKWYGLFVDNTAAAYNGSSYREGYTKAAIAANVDDAGEKQCAIIGWSDLTSDSSASVLGANTEGTTWGALGYKYGGSEYAGAFHGPVVATNSDMTADLGHNDVESFSAVRGDFQGSAVGRLGAWNMGMGPNHYTGAYGEATSAQANYGVYGYTEGGTENWGGFFIGDGFFSDNLGLGTTDVSGARLTIEGTGYNAFAGFNNTTASMEWRVGTWNDGLFRIVKVTGSTFTPVCIDTFGKVGIGTSSPSANLQVGVGTDDAIQIGSQKITDTGVWQFEIQGTMVPNLVTNNIGSASDEWQNVYCVALYESSDERLKTGIEDLDYGLDEIMRLHPVSYERTDRPWMGKNVGLIAQEVREVISEAVPTQTYTVLDEETGEMGYVDNEYLSIDYTDMVPVLIKAMQEQQAQIEELKAEIEQLKEAK